jgi:hypothetical protein
MRVVLTSVVLVALASFAAPQASVRINPGERSNRSAESRQAASTYCRLDYDGARLTPDAWKRIQPVTGWRDNPEFRRIAVVARYQIMPDAHSERGRMVFDVQYDLIGEYDLSGGYFPDPRRITVQVEVGDFSGDDRVLSTSEPSPFAGRPRLLQWLQARLATETDPVAKATIEASLQRLQDQSKKPEPGQ